MEPIINILGVKVGKFIIAEYDADLDTIAIQNTDTGETRERQRSEVEAVLMPQLRKLWDI